MAKKHAVSDVADTQQTGKVYEILKECHSSDPLKVDYYVRGITHPFAGRTRWVTLTKADSAATKDAAIQAALRA